MSEERITGEIRNTGSIADLAVTGPAIQQDPGLLKKVTSPSLFAYLACTRATGTAVVYRPDLTFELAFRDGAVIGLEQKGIAFLELVVHQLLSAGVIQADAAARAEATARETGRSLLQVFYDQGVCTPRDLVEAIRATKQAGLERIASLPSAAFEFVRTDHAPRASDPVAIDLNLFVVRLVRERTRTAHLVELEPFLNPVMGRYPLKTDRLTPAVLGVAFTEKERKTLTEVADGSLTLKEVFALSLLGRIGTARLFWMAALLGFVDYRMSPLPKGGIEVFEEELKRTLERVQSEDHFTRLQIHWTSHPSKIEPAYRRMVERWGPGASARRQSQRSADLAEAIFARMTESFQVLMDPNARREYRLGLLGRSKLEFGTEFLFKQAHLARFRGELDKAREIIEAAMDILPKPEFEEFLRGLGGLPHGREGQP